MMRNTYIYHILDHYIPEYSGYTFRSQYILNTQKLLGMMPVGIVSPLYTKGLSKKEQIGGIDFYRSLPKNENTKFSNIPFLKQWKMMRCFKNEIYDILKDKPKGIVHAHSPILNALPALSAARKLRMPFVYEVRAFWEDAAVDLDKTKETSLRYRITQFLETKVLKKADCVTTICEGLKRDMVRRGVREDKIHVIPNGVNMEVFSPKEKDKELINRYSITDKIVLGFIGSFYNYEGLDLLIKAMPRILAHQKDVALILVGSGEREEILKKLVYDLRLTDSVIFTGKVSHGDVPRYYSIMDILVYPRKKIRLTDLVTPLKPLEAMAMKKVVIGSDIGGIKELISDSSIGLLFQAGNVSALVSKCIELIEDKGKRVSIGDKGYQYVMQNRNWQSIVQGYKSIYESILN